MRSLNDALATGRSIPLLAAGCVLALAGCAAGTAADPTDMPESPHVTPSLSDLPTAEPSLSPTLTHGATDGTAPSPSPAKAELVVDSIGEVIVTDLVVRSAPGVGEDSEIQEFPLTTGDLVYVIEGPVPADGYDWLLVAELDEPLSGESISAGWIAPASRDGEEWVIPVAAACPSEISIDAFADSPVGLLLYCFGGEELTLEGALGFCAHGDPVIQDPAWLANYSCAFEKLDRPRVSQWPTLSVHIHPDADVPSFTGDVRPLRITGRFNAPEAESCRFIEGAELTVPGLEKLDEALLTFRCRASFVVESASPISP